MQVAMQLGKIKNRLKKGKSLTDNQANFLYNNISHEIFINNLKQVWPKYSLKIKQEPCYTIKLTAELVEELKKPTISKEMLLKSIEEKLSDMRIKNKIRP